MSLPNFRYIPLKTVKEACSLIAEHGKKGKVMAGGTDLLVRMKDRFMVPEYVLDLKWIPGLDAIAYDEREGLRIGALATLRSIEASGVIREQCAVIAEAAHVVGSMQVRSQATIGGNICNGSPSADMVPILMGLGARIKIVGVGKERVLSLDEFLIGPGQTALKAGEIVTEVTVPPMGAETGACYMKHTVRKAMDLAIVGVAAVIRLDAGHKRCEDIRIVLGAVAPTVVRAKEAEDALSGKGLDEGTIEKAAAQASSLCCTPISDVRGSAENRREMVRVFTRRAIHEAVKRLPGGTRL